MQCLGMEINSVNMTLGLSQEKKDIVQQSRSLLKRSSVTISKLNQLIRQLTATATAVFPAPLQSILTVATNLEFVDRKITILS